MLFYNMINDINNNNINSKRRVFNILKIDNNTFSFIRKSQLKKILKKKL